MSFFPISISTTSIQRRLGEGMTQDLLGVKQVLWGMTDDHDGPILQMGPSAATLLQRTAKPVR